MCGIGETLAAAESENASRGQTPHRRCYRCSNWQLVSEVLALAAARLGSTRKRRVARMPRRVPPNPDAPSSSRGRGGPSSSRGIEKKTHMTRDAARGCASQSAAASASPPATAAAALAAQQFGTPAGEQSDDEEDGSDDEGADEDEDGEEEAVEPMLAQAVNGQLRIAEAPEADAPEVASTEGGLAAAAAAGASASGEAMVELS